MSGKTSESFKKLRDIFQRKSVVNNANDEMFEEAFGKTIEDYDGALRRLAEVERKERLDELLAQCTPKNAHEEVDWGSPLIPVGFMRLSDGATIPTKAHPTDSGFDLYASEDVIIEPGETVIVPTGIAVELPAGYEAQVRPRSGITAKTKLRVQLGTIDQDYRGEIGVIVDNIGLPSFYFNETYKTIGLEFEYEPLLLDGSRAAIPGGTEQANTYLIQKGDRIAQLVVQPLPGVEVYEVEGDLDDTERGDGGFGSSGV